MEIYFSQFQRLKPKVLEDSVSGESPLSGSEMAIFLLGPHMVQRAKELSEASFYKDTNPICANHFSKAPYLQIPSHLRIKFQHTNFERKGTFSS